MNDIKRLRYGCLLLALLFTAIVCKSAINNNTKVDKQETVKAKPLVINTSVKNNLETDLDLGIICQRVQKNLNLSTDVAIAATTYENEDNIDLLARLVYSEVGNLNDEAQIATASVVLNRAQSSMYPDSIYGVIYDPGQYAVVDNGTINNSPDSRSYENARFVYENGTQIPENVLYQAEFEQGSGIYKIIDGMYFCYK